MEEGNDPSLVSSFPKAGIGLPQSEVDL